MTIDEAKIKLSQSMAISATAADEICQTLGLDPRNYYKADAEAVILPSLRESIVLANIETIAKLKTIEADVVALKAKQVV